MCVFVFVCLCEHLPLVYEFLQRQKKVSDPLQLEFSGGYKPLNMSAGVKPESSGRAISTLSW